MNTTPTPQLIQDMMNDWLGDMREQNFIHRNTDSAIKRNMRSDECLSEYFMGHINNTPDQIRQLILMRQAAEMIANNCSDRKVKVLFGGDTSFTDGRTINIATDHLDDRKLSLGEKTDILCGYAIHETAHVNHTDFDKLNMYLNALTGHEQRIKGQIQNMLEDERIEWFTGERYPGYADYLLKIKDHIWKNSDLKKKDRHKETLDQVLQTLFYAVRYPAQVNEDYVRDNYDILRRLRDAITPYPKTFNGILAATDRIYGIILDLIRKKMQNENRKKRQQQEQQNGQKQQGRNTQGRRSDNGQKEKNEQNNENGNASTPEQEKTKPNDSGSGGTDEDERREAKRRNEERKNAGMDDLFGDNEEQEQEDGDRKDGNTGRDDRNDEQNVEANGGTNDGTNSRSADESTDRNDKEDGEGNETEEKDRNNQTDSREQDKMTGSECPGEPEPDGEDEDEDDPQDLPTETEVRKELERQAGASKTLQDIQNATESPSGQQPLNCSNKVIAYKDVINEKIQTENIDGKEFKIQNVKNNFINYEAARKEITPYVGAMTRALKLKAKESEYILRGEKSGKLNPYKFALLRSGNTNIFNRRGEITCEGACICLLIDESGSMETKLTETRKAAVLVKESLKKISNLEFFAYGYSDEIIKVYNENRKGEQYALGNITDITLTPTGHAMKFAGERIRRFTDKKCLMLVLTDGGSRNKSYTREQDRQLKTKGIIPIGVGIQSTNVREEFEIPLVINDISTFATQLRDIVLNNIGKNLKKHDSLKG